MVLSLAACSSDNSDLNSKSDNQSKQSAKLQSGDITNDSSKEDIANYYNEVMKIARADESFQGDDNLSISDIQLNGETKESVKNMILSIGNSAINSSSGGDYEIHVPYFGQDVQVLPDDIESFSVVDNGDTLTLNIKPVAEENVTKRLNGPHGRFFEVYEDIQSAVSQVDQISFPDGVDNSLKIDYYGGTVNFTIDKKTKKILSGSTDMVVLLNITNAKVSILTLKSCTVTLSYKVDFPKAAE